MQSHILIESTKIISSVKSSHLTLTSKWTKTSKNNLKGDLALKTSPLKPHISTTDISIFEILKLNGRFSSNHELPFYFRFTVEDNIYAIFHILIKFEHNTHVCCLVSN